MAVEWTGLSPELLVPLDRNLSEGLRSQLERGLRDAIRTGRLRAGERLPSTRELANALGVSRGLVVDCFDQLQAEGYLVARAGSATRVASTAQAPPASSDPTHAGARAAARCRLPAGRARSGQLPPRRLGVGGPRDLPGGADRIVRLRRPVRQRGPADRPRQLPGQGAWRSRRPRPDRRVLRLRPGAQPRALGIGRAWRAAGRLRGSRLRRDQRDRCRLGGCRTGPRPGGRPGCPGRRSRRRGPVRSRADACAPMADGCRAVAATQACAR